MHLCTWLLLYFLPIGGGDGLGLGMEMEMGTVDCGVESGNLGKE